MRQRNLNARAQRGFTLTEILVTTAIFAIIMVAALAVYDRSNRVFKTSAEAADMQQSTRIGFDKLVSDLRMAGFDYNRGGVPNGIGQFPQPDEQIEYAGTSAVVFRANFDYNTRASSGNGLAAGYSPTNTTGGAIFPYVTTDNSEIVGYVLRSTAPNAVNGDTISFNVDSDVPRRAYPNVSGLTSGGHAERTVTISGIELTPDHPPYTLYRVTLADQASCATGNCTIAVGTVGTPVAENIRSVNFRYYTDGAGVTPLFNPPDPTTGAVTAITTGRNADGTTFTADPATCLPGTPSSWTNCTGAIGGAGLYDPANIGTTPNFADRLQRSTIQAVRVDLVGMNANPATDYQNATETNASFKNYREYALSSLVVPRNLGKTGFPEPSYNPPGPPTVTGMCIGHCGAPLIYWQAPTSGGPVVSYHVAWDTNQNGTFSNGFDIGDPTVRSAQIPDDGTVPDFSAIVYYQVTATNDNGTSQPSNLYQASPKNTTKPAAPTGLTATNNQNNQVTLTWVAPTDNAAGSLSCSGTGGTATTTPPIPWGNEIVRFRVARGTTANFDANDPTQSIQLVGYASPAADQPTPLTPSAGATVTWVDGPATSAAPPAACVQYYYRVRALDHCYQNASWNVSNNTADSMSAWSPAVAGQATSTSTPSQVPGTPLINRDPALTNCTSNANCKITIQWQKVARDTLGNAVAVDTYEIKRERRPQGVGAFVLDTTFNGTGTMDVSGFSQMTTPTWTDVIAAPNNLTFSDILTGPWEYRYTIAPKICSNLGAFSNPVLWPGCSIGATISANGASSGNGTTASSPWVLAYGDTIQVNLPGSVSINNVAYSIFVYPGGSQVGSAVTTTAGPNYLFSWSDLTDNQIYQVWVTITDNSSPACAETHVVYVQQEQQAACQFANQTPPTVSAPASQSTYAISGHPSTSEQAIYNFVIPNTTSTAINVNQTTPSNFTGTLSVTWRDPCLANPSIAACGGSTYPELVLAPSGAPVIWSTGACSSPLTLTSAASTLGPINTNASLTATFAMPSQSICNVPGSGSASLRLIFQYNGQHKPQLPSNPAALMKICISYKNPNDPTRTQFCNLVGQSGTTNNPRSCD